MSWFDRVRDKPPVAFQEHAGVKILKAAGHRVEGSFDDSTITVDDKVMSFEGFQAFVKGYALGRLDERSGK